MTNQTQADALRALIEKVEAGAFDPDPSEARGPYIKRFMDAADGCFPKKVTGCSVLAWSACEDDLNAAKALHEALLPNWVAHPRVGGSGAGIKFWNCSMENLDTGEEVTTKSQGDPARAWLLAILKAKLSEVEA